VTFGKTQLPQVRHLKLYNSGSFFDGRAIPSKDYKRIASLLKGFETVIVESHPGLINDKCLRFRDMLKHDLHIAIGLETSNTEILRKLNKRTIPDDFRNSISFLTRHGIMSRAFILLKPPFMSESEGIYWVERSLEEVTEYVIQLNSGRVFADVWDLGLFSSCKKCLEKRTGRLTEMNLTQKIVPPVRCTCDPSE
jgi:radical SAM enzyme (TIGR01210 family)